MRYNEDEPETSHAGEMQEEKQQQIVFINWSLQKSMFASCNDFYKWQSFTNQPIGKISQKIKATI